MQFTTERDTLMGWILQSPRTGNQTQALHFLGRKRVSQTACVHLAMNLPLVNEKGVDISSCLGDSLWVPY